MPGWTVMYFEDEFVWVKEGERLGVGGVDQRFELASRLAFDRRNGFVGRMLHWSLAFYYDS